MVCRGTVCQSAVCHLFGAVELGLGMGQLFTVNWVIRLIGLLSGWSGLEWFRSLGVWYIIDR